MIYVWPNACKFYDFYDTYQSNIEIVSYNQWRI